MKSLHVQYTYYELIVHRGNKETNKPRRPNPYVTRTYHARTAKRQITQRTTRATRTHVARVYDDDGQSQQRKVNPHATRTHVVYNKRHTAQSDPSHAHTLSLCVLQEGCVSCKETMNTPRVHIIHGKGKSALHRAQLQPAACTYDTSETKHATRAYTPCVT